MITNNKMKILYADGLGGLIVGSVLLFFSHWFVGFYSLPHSLVLFVGVANVLYGIYSSRLALSKHRSLIQIKVLVFANTIWAIVCSFLMMHYWATASLWGLLHLLAEGIYVLFLANCEWQWRRDLL